MTQPLSPAAQAEAVLNAANEACSYGPDDVLNDSRQIAAAVLRAIADQDETLFDVEGEVVPAVRAVRTDRIVAIAAELEGRKS